MPPLSPKFTSILHILPYFPTNATKLFRLPLTHAEKPAEPHNRMIDAVLEHTDYGILVKIPRQIRNYIYLKTIGTGGSSVVILLQETHTQVTYAGKVVPRAALVESRRMQFFERELRLLEILNHENICRLEEVIFLPEVVVVVTEHCPNGDLLTFLTENTFIVTPIKRRMFYELCLAVAYLHSRNLAHRDLKPDNIFIDEELHVKLGDFGLVRESADGPILKTVCGTPMYNAPEVLAHQTYDGKKADVWGLGIVLCCMETGRLPWTSGDMADIQKQIMSGEVTLPEEVPKAVAEVILACLRKDPDARPSVQEVLEMDWLKGEVIRKVQAVPGAQMKPVQSAMCGRPSNPMLKLPALLISNRTTRQFNGLVQSSRRVFTRRTVRARKSDVH